jgi:dipeptidyl aminopeptidase/acylaminoacyl peptidase
MLEISPVFQRLFTSTKLTATALLFSVAAIQPAIAVAATASFPSGGASIRMDVYPATGSGTHPSVLFLYGADGMALAPWDYPYVANWFASQGYNFFIVHYFDTGSTFATPQTFGQWLQAVNDATTWISTQPGVDPSRIAMMGWSLGANLGVSAASRDYRIRALAAWYGGEATWYENAVKNTITHMPATIIIHGGSDPLSSVANAYALQSLLQGLNIPCAIDIYPNEGHGFNPTDQNTALQQTLAFFQQYL